jgi:hypothetical protein
VLASLTCDRGVSMGVCSRLRVLGFRELWSSGVLVCLIHPRRRPKRKVVPMGVFTSQMPKSRSATTGRFAASDPELAGRLPALVEFLTECLTEEGVARVTSTLGVSCEDGVWKVCLTDRAQAGQKFDFKMWKSGASLLDALKALDEDLQGGSPEWRRFAKWAPPKRT